MKPEPEVREDGRCHVCHNPRRPERSRQYGGIAAELDSFCSSTCARAFHDNPIPDIKQPRAKGVSMYLDVEWKRRQRANPEYRARENAYDRERRRAERSSK